MSRHGNKYINKKKILQVSYVIIKLMLKAYVCSKRWKEDINNKRHRKGNSFYLRPKSEWDPAKKFKLPHFSDESNWECPLCDRMIAFDEVHIEKCPFITLENQLPHVSSRNIFN